MQRKLFLGSVFSLCLSFVVYVPALAADAVATPAEQPSEAPATETPEKQPEPATESSPKPESKDADSEKPAKESAEKKEIDQTEKADKHADKSDQKKEDKPKKSQKLTLAGLTLKGSFPEGSGQAGLFGEISPSLHQLIARLDQIASDDKLSGVILRLRSPEIGRGQVEEIRAAIARIQKNDKKVYADLQSATAQDYLLACACDEIIMPSSGMLAVPGVRVEVAFYKDLLDKIGVQADMMQVGDFKGAAEPVTRTEMSSELRAQLEAIVDDYYCQLVEIIAADRKLDQAEVRKLIDQGIFTPNKALEAGLIDRVAYEDELRDQLKTALEADELQIIQNYGKEKIDTDFSGISGMMKFMDLMTGQSKSRRNTSQQKIAVVYAVGTIMPGSSTSGLFAEAVGSDTIIRALRKAETDKRVSAIILRVDSPGGSALASDLIWREVVRIEKPIIASMGDTAASGGYYISMGADKIFAEAGTLTGSIGVVGGKMTLKRLMDKLGVNAQVVSRGQNSGWLSSIEPFTDSERAAWKSMMTETYDQFTEKAAQGRGMELDQLQQLAQGRVFTGRMAVEHKLVDKIGTLQDAIAEAKQLGGLSAEEKVEIMILPEPRSFFEELFGGAQIESSLRAVAPMVTEQFQGLGVIQQLFAEPSVTLMPYKISIQ